MKINTCKTPAVMVSMSV